MQINESLYWIWNYKYHILMAFPFIELNVIREIHWYRSNVKTTSNVLIIKIQDVCQSSIKF